MKTFFDEENRLERLTELGDVLVRLTKVVNEFLPIYLSVKIYIITLIKNKVKRI